MPSQLRARVPPLCPQHREGGGAPPNKKSQTIVSPDVARDAKLIVRPTLTELQNASNSVMHLVGESEVVLCNNKHSVFSTVLVASHLNHAALISWQDLQKLHVIPKTFLAVAAVACVNNEMKTKTIAAFSSVFSDTLNKKPMCAQRMKIYLRITPSLTAIQLFARFPGTGKLRDRQAHRVRCYCTVRQTH